MYCFLLQIWIDVAASRSATMAAMAAVVFLSSEVLLKSGFAHQYSFSSGMFCQRAASPSRVPLQHYIDSVSFLCRTS